jgi:hypothetical protein
MWLSEGIGRGGPRLIPYDLASACVVYVCVCVCVGACVWDESRRQSVGGSIIRVCTYLLGEVLIAQVPAPPVYAACYMSKTCFFKTLLIPSGNEHEDPNNTHTSMFFDRSHQSRTVFLAGGHACQNKYDAGQKHVAWGNMSITLEHMMGIWAHTEPASTNICLRQQLSCFLAI